MAWSDEARQAALAARRAAAAAHQSGVANVGQHIVSDKAVQAIQSAPHGTSVALNGEQPNRGYMVAQPGRTSFVNTHDLTGGNAKAILNAYAERNRDQLTQPGRHIGVWHDSATGKTHLDVADNIPRQRHAISTGRSRNQISIYDVKRNRTINTGGRGD